MFPLAPLAMVFCDEDECTPEPKEVKILEGELRSQLIYLNSALLCYSIEALARFYQISSSAYATIPKAFAFNATAITASGPVETNPLQASKSSDPETNEHIINGTNIAFVAAALIVAVASMRRSILRQQTTEDCRRSCK